MKSTISSLEHVLKMRLHEGNVQLQGQGAVARGALTAREGGQAQLRCRRRQRGLDAIDGMNRLVPSVAECVSAVWSLVSIV